MSNHPNHQEIVDLEERIEGSLEINPKHQAAFLPDNLVGLFAKPDEVHKALRAAGLGNRNDLARFVLASAQHIFLILVMMSESREKLSYLEGFLENNITDRSLPLRILLRRATTSDEPRRQVNLSKWKKTDIDLFDKWQWAFCSPVFKDTFQSLFHPQTILPYLSTPTNPAGEGFFGKVFKVDVHPAHLPQLGSTSRDTPITVALKQIRNDIPEKYMKYLSKERRNLDMLNTYGYTSPNLIKPIAYYELAHDIDDANKARFLIFPWADGGSLLDYWEQCSDRPTEAKDIQWIIGQFAGLFSALDELHMTNCRHGDLKPDNILWFKNDGVLQIADLGLATFHKLITEMRREDNQQTMTPSGNLRYSPPETGREGLSNDARSRLYDIWSMGCVLLEMLVWLSYGMDGVNRFWELKKFFWTEVPGQQKPQVNPFVSLCMDCLDEDLRGCDALRGILRLVRTGLLVIDVDGRETAENAYRWMDGIRMKWESVPSYRASIQARRQFPITADGRRRGGQLQGMLEQGHSETEKYKSGSERTNIAMKSNHQEYPVSALQMATQEVADLLTIDNRLRICSNRPQFQSPYLDDVWECFPDNEFAAGLLKSLDWDRVKPDRSQLQSAMCSKCSDTNATPLFDEQCDTSKLEESCALCGILLQGLRQAGIVGGEIVRLRQTSTIIGIENGPNLISLYAEPGPSIPAGCQIGLPQLFGQASQDQFALLKAWLQVCDSTHDKCRRKYQLDGFCMPTRLIEVGDTVRLVLSESIEPSHYVALSHCWGKLEESQKFCTYQNNIEQLKASINVEGMPQTFKDAITVTRRLGVKYLWIDSLCIIQDDDADWEHEAGQMEQVFSGAYCTIGASSAKSSLDGFLADRLPRPCVQIQTENVGPLYGCLAIDDFYRDVELSELNKRGWVMQERALSRRTIFYSSSQVYWECGAGVHCETLGRLYNPMAAFIGDANFPASALAHYRNGRQTLIHDLYERYSALAFTKPSDRSVAILGLQKRLARALETRAAYGFFEAYFARELLWKRGQDQGLAPISYAKGKQPPSWSWFSKEGAIQHLDTGFKEIDWTTDDYENPFKRISSTSAIWSFGSDEGSFSPVLRGLARCMKMPKDGLLAQIVFDRKQEHNVDDLRCVIIGRDKTTENNEDSRMVHVLVVARLDSAKKEDIYERVGVASLGSATVASQGSWVDIW